jgi:hypothetical protein
VCLSNLCVAASSKVGCTLLSFATSVAVRDLFVRWEAGREVGAEAGQAVWSILCSSFDLRVVLPLAWEALVCVFLGAGEDAGEGVDEVLFSREVLALAFAIDSLASELLDNTKGVSEGPLLWEVLVEVVVVVVLRVVRLVGAGEWVSEEYGDGVEDESDEMDNRCLAADLGLDGMDGFLTSFSGALV